MRHWTSGPETQQTTERTSTSSGRLLADGGQEQEEDESAEASHPEDDSGEGSHPEDQSAEGESEEIDDETSGGTSSNVNVMDAGEAKPAEPKWEEPDIDNVEDIPEVEGPKTRPSDWKEADAPTAGKSGGATDEMHGETSDGVSDDMPDGILDDMSGEIPGGPAADDTATSGGTVDDGDPTAGMPNTARSPGETRLKEGSADGYVVALELCANLPDDIRLPDEAADLVPVALEAELEQSVQQFAGEQFENPSPHVETLDFVEVDGDIWFRLRLGIPPEAFTDLDPQEIQEFALQKIEGML